MKITFSIEYYTRWGESLSLVMGGKKYPMQWGEGSLWSVTVDAASSDLKSYGYVVVKDGIIVRIEWSDHSAAFASGTKAASVRDWWIDCPIAGCPFVRNHSAAQFDHPGFRGAGVAVAVFSLRSRDDFGIGEFLDLKAVVDWAASCGLCIIQLLPVTDTTRSGGWEDCYPYSPVSSFALHPLYVNLQRLGVRPTASFSRKQKELNALSRVDYPQVFKEKMALLRKAFASRGGQDIQSVPYRKFCRDNAFWLGEYARFCACRDGDNPDFWSWIQWHLDMQFSEVVGYAHSRGICFKGDLPIGVSLLSADTFWHPELFNLDSSAGAPPDVFSDRGQCWGFPTYNWEAMEKDGYSWWKERLKRMAHFFDAFRIDHILGFFRIWELPVGSADGLAGHFNPALSYTTEEISAAGLPVEGLFNPDPHRPGFWQPAIAPGAITLSAEQKERFEALHTDFFYHRNNDFWRRNAMKKLPEIISATGMLACGEDLGMVPDCVGGVMSSLGILSLEMKMAPKGREWPRLAVCATSSHDSSTLRMQYAAGHDGRDMPVGKVRESLMEHLSSAPMLAVFPLQDFLALDGDLRRKDFMAERINDPSTSDGNWRFRLHLDVARLKASGSFNAGIREMLSETGRLLD